MVRRTRLATAAIAAVVCAAPAAAQSFVNWESPQVHPLATTPGDVLLLAVNTPDNRLEVYLIDIEGGLVHRRSVPVGLDPVSVRARTATEAWVVNRISDSVSIVDLDTFTVVATIRTGDEPGDVVFAGGKAFVSIGTANEIWVYDTPYSAGQVPTIVPIAGEDPRALSTDGTTVHALIFNAGNRTSVIDAVTVGDPNTSPYFGTPNPPPNFGLVFVPPINPALLPAHPPPPSPIIVKQNSNGDWLDDNHGNWSIGPSGGPPWTLHGHAMAHIDAASLAVTYTSDLMTNNAALDTSPVDGEVACVGQHAFNHIRFVPVLRGIFVSMGEALVPAGGGAATRLSLNPHLSQYFPDGNPIPVSGEGGGELSDVDGVQESERLQTIGDPRGIAWSADGAYQLVTGRGTNNLAKLGADGARLDLTSVGPGPTGVKILEDGSKAYVLNRFENSISIVDMGPFQEIGRVQLFDPTPDVILTGRPRFYDTFRSSALGQAGCASCHVDGRMDLLAWDLGDPSGNMHEFDQICIGSPTPCEETDWHPMKGPLVTQTLLGVVGTEPLHWRGDMADVAAFNAAFPALQGTTMLSPAEMDEFVDFVATLTVPPNPFRLITDELPTSLPNGGDAVQGKFLFDTPFVPPGDGSEAMSGKGGAPGMLGRTPGDAIHPPLVAQASDSGDVAGTGGLGCNVCHAGSTGTNQQIQMPIPTPDDDQLFKVPQLRDQYCKDGFDKDAFTPLNRGTGYLHSGILDTIEAFLFRAFEPVTTQQDRLDLAAYMLAFSTDTHAGVGVQAMIGGLGGGQAPLRDQLISIADTGEVGLVVHGSYLGETRGFSYLGSGNFQSDRLAEIMTTMQLDVASAGGDKLTYMLVPLGTELRIGVDRDEDGFFDMDESDLCADPADPAVFPGSGSCCGDLNHDGLVAFNDLLNLLSDWGPCQGCPQDLSGNGAVGFEDLIALLGVWGACP